MGLRTACAPRTGDHAKSAMWVHQCTRSQCRSVREAKGRTHRRTCLHLLAAPVSTAVREFLAPTHRSQLRFELRSATWRLAKCFDQAHQSPNRRCRNQLNGPPLPIHMSGCRVQTPAKISLYILGMITNAAKLSARAVGGFQVPRSGITPYRAI